MAEEKKPRIDLKTRLQKMGAGGQVANTGSSPPVIPVPARSAPGNSIPAPAIPIPPGVPSPFGAQPAQNLDPSNPLAALAQPFRSGAPPAAAPPQPQRIEVDESTVQEARASVRKTMLVIVGIASLLFAGIGWFIGKAGAEGKARESLIATGTGDAKEVATKIKAVEGQLTELLQTLRDGKSAIFEGVGGKKSFPKDLPSNIGKIKFELDPGSLADKRFAGVKKDVIKELFDFVASLQVAQERQDRIQRALNSLQKSFEKDFEGVDAFKVVMFFDKDLKGELPLVTLKEPLAPGTREKPLPEKLTLERVGDVPRYAGGELKEKAAILVSPRAMDAVCVSKDNLAKQRLSSDMAKLMQEIDKETGGGDEPSDDAKEGLLKRARNLNTALTAS